MSLRLGLALLAGGLAASGAFAENLVGKDGRISLPEDFRSAMAHLGSWYVPDGAASGFHDVYVSREAVSHYRSTGRFPDGAVLVKELRASSGADYTTGQNVQSATATVKQWFVMVKDDSDKFPDNPLWGDGWGWALFKPDAPTVNVASDYRSDCLGCHLPARATDLIYIDAYPTLRP